MKTKRLFYENVYRTEFEAEVLSCEKWEKGCRIVLDRTAFYPEGGGQPSDWGQLVAEDGSEQCRVLYVHYDGETIVHDTDSPVSKGSRVKGFIDWERRFDFMQQHSGEHLVSGFIHELYGYHNVGFHMGEDVITVDVSGTLSKEQAAGLELRVNEYIWGNHPAHIHFPSEEERERLRYRSKKELTGEVRLVEFPGGDCCACCGLHVEHTGEIGIVKILSVHRFREGSRLEMVSGKRAFSLLSSHYAENAGVAAELSVRGTETGEAVKRLLEENYRLKGREMQLKQEKNALRAGQCKGMENIALFEEEMEASDVRREADAILDACCGLCVVFSGKDAEGYKYAAGQRSGDVREFVKEMNRQLNGRGGGKPFFAQGSLKASRKEMEAFLRAKGISVLSS